MLLRRRCTRNLQIGNRFKRRRRTKQYGVENEKQEKGHLYRIRGIYGFSVRKYCESSKIGERYAIWKSMCEFVVRRFSQSLALFTSPCVNNNSATTTTTSLSRVFFGNIYLLLFSRNQTFFVFITLLLTKHSSVILSYYYY